MQCLPRLILSLFLLSAFLVAHCCAIAVPQNGLGDVALTAVAQDDEDCEDRLPSSVGCTDELPTQMSPPTVAVDNDRASHLTISWQPLPSRFNVYKYVLQQTEGDAEPFTAYSGKDTTFEIEDYRSISPYDFAVSAINCAGQTVLSEPTHLDSVAIVDGPDAPRVTGFTPKTVSLRWSPSADEPKSWSVVQYRSAEGPPPSNTRSDLWDDWQDGFHGDSTSAVVSDLKPGTHYWFRLAYVDGANSRPFSAMVGAETPPDVPDQCLQPVVKWVGSDKTSLQVKWRCTEDGGKPITRYHLEMTSDMDDEFSVLYSGSETQYTAQLSPGRTYSFRVSATNELGTGKVSSIQGMLCPAHVPSQPSSPTMAGRTVDSITVRWRPSAIDGGAEIKSYSLEMADGFGFAFAEVSSGLAFEYHATGLHTNTHYRFRVTAINRAGRSLPSEILGVHTARGEVVCAGGTGAGCFGNGQCDLTTRKCVCDPGNVLEDCSGLPCPANCTDPSHGACDYSVGTCKCVLGWVGPECAQPDRSHLCPDFCGRGDCDKGTGLCVCESGFAGERCDELDCSMHNQCNGHGSCIGIGVCQCDEGYYSPDCGRPMCTQLSECSGHGQCDMPGHCECLPAYFTESCASSLCGPGDCSNHGICVGENTCDCEEGFKGNKCELAVCPSDCSGNGKCVDPGQCDCDEGWVGVDCSIALCLNVEGCNGRGSCVAPETCECDAGWGGKMCNEFRCEKNCSQNGQCVGPLNCICDPGWNDAACDVPDCDEVKYCSENGACSTPNNCSCNAGWQGKECNQPMCDLVKECSDHGTCTSPQICTCFDGFGGTECEERVKPTNCIEFARPVDSLDMQRSLINGLQMFTVEGWFRLPGLGARVTLVAQRDLFEVFATRKFNPGQTLPLDEEGNPTNPIMINFQVVTFAGAVSVSQPIVNGDLNEFHYFAATIDQNRMALYLDGGLAEEVATPGEGTLTSLGSSDFTVVVGGGVADPRIEEVPSLTMGPLRIWSQVRTLSEIQAHMVEGAETVTSSSSSLIGFWKFDDGFGSYAGDASPNMNTGRLIGEPTFEREQIPTITPPKRPLMVEHEVIDSRTVRVMWEAAADDGGAAISAFTLEQSNDFVNFDVVYEGPDLEFEISSLSASRFYAFRVASRNFAGFSDYSEVSYFGTTPGTPFAPKEAPTLAFANETSVTVSWVRPKCNGSLLTDYTLEVLDRRTAVRVLGLSVDVSHPRKAAIYGLLPGRPYTVRVRGVNALGNGTWSSETEMQTTAAPPSPPLFGEVSPDAHSVTLRWQPAPNNGDAVRQYVIQRAVVSPRDITSLAAAPQQPESPAQRRERAQLHRLLSRTSNLLQIEKPTWLLVGRTSGLTFEFVDTSAKPGMKYSYRIRADNDAGLGKWTEAVVTTLAAVPSSPVEVRAHDVTTSQFQVKWKRPDANGPAIFEYIAEMAELADPPLWTEFYRGTQLSSSTPKNLLPGTTYLVRTTARNCKGLSKPSPTLTVLTKSSVPDAPPLFLLRKRSSEAVVLWWSVPNGNGANQLTYRVEMRRGDGRWREVYSNIASNATIRELSPVTKYDFRVVAINIVGASQFSKTLSVETLAGTPSAMDRPTVVSKGPRDMTVQWGSAASNGRPLLAYQVFAGPSDSEELDCVYHGNDSVARLLGLMPATVYRVRVRALNALGAGEFTEVVTETLPETPSMPLAPTVVSKTEDSITVEWDRHNNTGAFCDAENWILSVAHDKNETNATSFLVTYRGPNTTYTLNNLVQNRTYLFVLQGINSFGAGEPSQPLAASPLESNTVPDSPKGLNLVSSDANTLVIGWEEQGLDNRQPLIEYVVESSPAFTTDSLSDVSEQGWVQPPWEKDPRVFRQRKNATELKFSEVYRGTTAEAILSGLSPGSSYSIRVRAINQLGESRNSPTLVFQTSPSAPAPPLAPQIVGTSATEMRVEWERPADGGSPIAAYEVTVDNVFYQVNASTRFFIAKPLKAGSSHKVSLTAINELGRTTSREVSSKTLPGAPPKPTRPIVVNSDPNEEGLPTMMVRWPTAQTAGADIVGYTLEMKDIATRRFLPLITNQLANDVHVDTDVIPSTQYSFRLIVHSVSGVSEPSDVQTAVSSTIIPLKPPTPRLHGLTSTSALLMWDDRLAGENSFQLRMGTNGTRLDVCYEGHVAKHELVDLVPDTRYIVQLRSVSGKGNGAWSDELVFNTETTCVSDDGSVCSGRGQCVEGACVCYKRYTGVRCQHAVEPAVCSAWGGGHYSNFDNNVFVAPAVGEHVLYTPSSVVEDMDVTVHVHSRPVQFTRPNVTAIDSVAIRVGPVSNGTVLTLSTSRRAMRASNNVYVRVDCGPSRGVDVRSAFEAGLDLGQPPFHIRYDAAKRFIVSVAGSPIRIIVQPFRYEDRTFLNAFVVDRKPRVGEMRGLCGSFASIEEDAPALPRVNSGGKGGLAVPTWVDQWTVDVATSNITQCPEDTNPLFDDTPPITPPTDQPSSANDQMAADMDILTALETEVFEMARDDLPVDIDQVCGDGSNKDAGKSACQPLSDSTDVFAACVWDTCALDASHLLLGSHADARKTIIALQEAVATQVAADDSEEQQAESSGTLTNGQQRLPVCPQ